MKGIAILSEKSQIDGRLPSIREKIRANGPVLLFRPSPTPTPTPLTPLTPFPSSLPLAPSANRFPVA